MTGLSLRVAAIAALLVLGACSPAERADVPPPEADPTADTPADDRTEDSGDTEEELRPFVMASGPTVAQPNEQVGVYAVAEQLGFFEEEGLDVELVLVGGSTEMLQAVAGGEADTAAADGSAILSAVEAGVPISAYGGLVQNWPWRIGVLADGEVQAPEDLRGRSIGVISLASGSNPYARAWAESFGLAPEQDVDIVPVGIGPPAAAALESGEADALALFTQAYVTLENAGFEFEYFDNPPEFDLLRSITFSARDEMLADEPEVLASFGRAAYRALLFSAANPEAAMRIGYEVIPDLLPESGDPEENLAADVAALQAWIDTAVPQEGGPEDWGEWGTITEEEWQQTMEFTEFAGQIQGDVPLDEVWDPTLLDQMNDWDREEVLQAAEDWQP